MTGDTLWAEIARTLAAEIADGIRAPGDRLPSEAALAARFGVNRHTVRRALGHLADTGLVAARRGAGRIVTARPTTYPLGARVRFRQAIAATGRVPGRRVEAIETRAPTDDEARRLALGPGARVIDSQGVVTADGQPIALFASVFPDLPGLADALADAAGVTAALARIGIADYLRAETEITATAATPLEATRLGLAPGTPLLLTRSLNVTPDGTPIERGQTRFAADRVTLTLTQP